MLSSCTAEQRVYRATELADGSWTVMDARCDRSVKQVRGAGRVSIDYGSRARPEHLFTTREEARAYVDAQNAKLAPRFALEDYARAKRDLTDAQAAEERAARISRMYREKLNDAAARCAALGLEVTP